MTDDVFKIGTNNDLIWICPGCKRYHQVYYGEGRGPRWSWNGDLVKPTLSPSVLTTTTEFTEKGEADYDAWVDAGCNDPVPVFDSVKVQCHSYVVDGNMQFLSDCTHKLAGTTVPIPPCTPYINGDES